MRQKLMQALCLWCCKCASVSDWMSHGGIECSHKMFTRMESDWLHAVMSFFTYTNTRTHICVRNTNRNVNSKLLIFFSHLLFHMTNRPNRRITIHTQIHTLFISLSLDILIRQLVEWNQQKKAILMRKKAMISCFMFTLTFEFWREKSWI